jgi:N-acetylmuramoyl-L-alanine amidase
MILTTAAATCLALNIYWEARNQDYDGQLLVAEVTMNRVYSDKFPNEICDVVYSKKAFSWTHDGLPDKPKNVEAYLEGTDNCLRYATQWVWYMLNSYSLSHT